MSLADFQEAFTQALFTPFPDGSEVSRVPHLQDSALTTMQFQAVRDRVLARLTLTLSDVYPTVVSLMGKTLFKAAARDYFMEHRPEAADPVNMTRHFPIFLAQCELAERMPYLADMATLEQGYYQSARTQDVSALSTRIFTELSPEQLAVRQVQLHPGCYWFASPYAVYDIWQSQRTQSKPPEAYSIPQDVLIIRPHLSVELHKIDAGFVRTLDELDNGKSLGQALTLGNLVDQNFNTAAAMQFLIQNDLIVALY